MARVVVEHVTKLFSGPGAEPIAALRDISLTVADKEIFVVVGPSGCGKTTLLRLIAGLEKPTCGRIWIDEQLLTSPSRDVAMVFQHPALYPHLSVYENMAFGLRMRHCPKPEIEQRVIEAAEMLGLAHCLLRRPMELSGGQRQRVALGRAIVRRPKLLLYDEPLSNLDPHLRNQLRVEISKLHHRVGGTAIYVTHDQAEAMLLGQRVAVLDQGVSHQTDEPLNLYRRPSDLFVAGFFGAPPMNFFNGTLTQRGRLLMFAMKSEEDATSNGLTALAIDEGLRSILEDFVGKELVLGIRPEHICAHLPQANAAPPEPNMLALVNGVDHLGSEVHLRLARDRREFMARMYDNGSIAIGKTLQVRFQMDQAHFFNPTSGKRIEQG
jgi:multiple sugar transport system ATP-binding protein